MDRNTFTGLFLIFVILVGSTFLLKPSEFELKKEKILQDSLARTKTMSVATTLPITADYLENTSEINSTVFNDLFDHHGHTIKRQPIILENELLKITINPKGGRVESVELKKFKTFDQKPLILFEGDHNKFGLEFNVSAKPIYTNDLYFSSSSTDLMLSKKDSASVTMRLNYAQDKYIEYIYSLTGESYQLGFKILTKGMQDVVHADTKYLTLNWETVLKQKERDIESEKRYSSAYYQLADQEVDYLNVSDDDKKEVNGFLQWVSFKQHFFSNVLIAKNGFSKGIITINNSTDPQTVKLFSAKMQMPFLKDEINSYSMEFYFGPNKFSNLKNLGYGVEKQIDLGYWPLKYINRYAVLPVFNFLEGFNWNYGLIILFLTILLKLALFPLTYKSYLSMAKMRVLKPEMDEIKLKVGENNPTLLQQEYLKLYKKAGVNPLGGCLPMLFQLPIIMAFFFFFPNLFELRQESFLWMKDLSTYDAFFNFGFNIPFLGAHISLMCVLMTISTLIYTYFNNQIAGTTGQMKYIGYISPIIFFGVLNSYPAGLNYYYFLANMITFLQQYVIRQFVNDDKIHAQIQENKKKPRVEKKQSGFQKRLDDYMRQQNAKSLPKKK